MINALAINKITKMRKNTYFALLASLWWSGKYDETLNEKKIYFYEWMFSWGANHMMIKKKEEKKKSKWFTEMWM